MDKKLFQSIKEITEIQATSGFEHNMREYLVDRLQPLVDRVEFDGLGGTFGIKENNQTSAPRLMVAAHMDEIGFLVTNITEGGFLKVTPLGGWNPQVVGAQRYTLQTTEGDYPVISSSIPPHLSKNSSGKIDLENILFDGGFDDKEEALGFGVKPGDSIVPDVETIPMANGKTFVSKAWDNRYGVTVILEVLKELQQEKLPNELIIGGNVQEEVGLRGTKGAVTKFDPDVFFAVDCSPADDVYGSTDSFGKLGQGTLLRIQDPSYIMSREMREFLLDTAETHDIPYQYFVSKGGTDASISHQLNQGIPSSVIGVSARYIHTHQTLFHIDDFYAAKEMLKQVILNLDQSTVDTLKFFK